MLIGLDHNGVGPVVEKLVLLLRLGIWVSCRQIVDIRVVAFLVTGRNVE